MKKQDNVRINVTVHNYECNKAEEATEQNIN